MYKLFIAVFLFGLLHPGSKYIFSTGLGIYFFSFYFLFIRTIVGVPAALLYGGKKINLNDLIIFIGLGVIGSVLQVSEFIAVYNGVPISTVSFLIFTLPLWSIILGRFINNEFVTKLGIAKIMLVLTGTIIISWNALALDINFSSLFWPIFSGFLLGLWVCVSKKIRAKGYSSLTINAVYDFFSTMFLIVFLLLTIDGTELTHNLNWLGSIKNIITIVIYSLLLGFLANILVYNASKSISAASIGIAMSLEPIIATAISIILFDEKLTYQFLAGSVLLVIANIPESIINHAIEFLQIHKSRNHC